MKRLKCRFHPFFLPLSSVFLYFICLFLERFIILQLELLNNRHAMKRKKSPIGVQDFKSLIEDGFLYIDKTDIIYKLVNDGRNAFLSRPRRFGKSLLCSTLRYYFQGEKELFKGLRIYDLEKDWTKHPVLYFCMNTGEYSSLEMVRSTLSCCLDEYEAIYGKNIAEENLANRFFGIIKRAYEQTGQKVVVLIDEYDKPLLETLDNKELNEQTRKVLKSFYGVLKAADVYIRFIFLTGVTKFSKVSVFSDLNNLADISFQNDYATICGITEEELLNGFDDEIEALAAAEEMSKDEMIAELKHQYDGYHFSSQFVDIYNPFSVLSAFKANEIGDYWFATGTPTYLTRMIKNGNYDLHTIPGVESSVSRLGDISEPEKDIVPILFQSGYLTLKAYDRKFKTYTLDFPNGEVRNGFLYNLLPQYTPAARDENSFGVSKFVRDVENNQIDAFLTRLKSLVSKIPYTQIPDEERDNLLEQQYQNVAFIIFTLMGYYVEVEQHFSEGRIDLVVKTATHIYIMEFKVGEGTADAALEQINEKHYAAPYLAEEKQIVKIGIGWSQKTRNIDDWKIEV